MFWRLISLWVLLGLGSALGYLLGVGNFTQHEGWAVWAGALIATLVWGAVDAWRGMRVIAWLRDGDLAMAPQTFGVWGNVVNRVRRLLRLRERAHDIAEQRLQDFLLAIQASPNGMTLLDRNLQIEWCNQTASLQLGIDIDRDKMQRIGNLLRDPIFSAYMNQEDPREGVVIEGRNHRPDFPVRLFLQRHRYGDGKQLLMTRDVTELEKAERMRRDFVANVSHEIRTPLTVLAGFVETMQSLDLSSEDRQRYLGMMATQAQRMQSLVEDLLTLSRLEGSPEAGAAKQLPIAELMRACELEAHALSAVLNPTADAHVIEFETDNALRGAALLGQPKELQSALSNLVSNAIRYTPTSGRVTVRASRSLNGEVSFVVRDTGPGIAQEHLSRLTERFYRVDKSRSRDTGGTGLGLAIVKHVMSRHKGVLLISSVIGQGSTFELKFPASKLVLPV